MSDTFVIGWVFLVVVIMIGLSENRANESKKILSFWIKFEGYTARVVKLTVVRACIIA